MGLGTAPRAEVTDPGFIVGKAFAVVFFGRGQGWWPVVADVFCGGEKLCYAMKMMGFTKKAQGFTLW